MMTIGLTGGIGMGKSTAAKILNRLGFPIYNADDAVHSLMGQGGDAVKPIARLFPDAVKNGVVDRKILGSLVFGKPEPLKKLEAILHPRIRKIEKSAIAEAKKTGHKAIILEIPLLFETGGQERCDFVITVTAPRTVQQARVMRRKGMTLAKFKSILKHQITDRDRKQHADYIVRTDKGLADTKRQLCHILEQLGLLG